MVGAGAALLGAVLGAVGAWGSSLIVEHRRENMEVISALELVRDEIEENAVALEVDAGAAELVRRAWDQEKHILAGPGRRALSVKLWDELRDSYRAIHPESLPRSQASAPLDRMNDAELNRLARDLGQVLDAFEQKLATRRFWTEKEHRPPDEALDLS